MNCHHYKQKHCLSCDLLSHDYLTSIAFKSQSLLSLFPTEADKIKPAVFNENGLEGSRNKAKLAVAEIENDIEFGFYDQHMRFKKLEDCPLHAPAINAVLVEIKNQIKAHNVTPYNLKLKTGELKYILITYSESTNELLIRFVMRSKTQLDQLKKLAAVLTENNAAIKVVTVNIQSTHQAVLEGEEEIVLTDQDHITHQFGECVLFQGPRSFFQTNSDIAKQLYQQLQQEISQLSIHSILDLYCGVGAFSFFANKHCQKVIGVEISDAAISYANKARETNSCFGMEFIAMDAEKYLMDQKENSFDAIIVNPPRRGLNETIITHLMRLAPKYVFYSSCNAETLQRDISQLRKQYNIESLQLFDMFPFTKHFETLAVLAVSS